MELKRVESMSQRELGARLRLEKSTVSRLAAQLERRGLVHRDADRSDGRVTRVALTAKGARFADRSPPPAASACNGSSTVSRPSSGPPC